MAEPSLTVHSAVMRLQGALIDAYPTVPIPDSDAGICLLAAEKLAALARELQARLAEAEARETAVFNRLRGVLKEMRMQGAHDLAADKAEAGIEALLAEETTHAG